MNVYFHGFRRVDSAARMNDERPASRRLFNNVIGPVNLIVCATCLTLLQAPGVNMWMDFVYSFITIPAN